MSFINYVICLSLSCAGLVNVKPLVNSKVIYNQPGSYIQEINLSQTQGEYLMKVGHNTVTCNGNHSNRVIIKYDGFEYSCRFSS